jgi:hypothetical protein
MSWLSKLARSEYVSVDSANLNVLSFLRKTKDGKAVLVSLNLSSSARDLKLDLKSADVSGTHLKALLVSTPEISPADVANISLLPYGSYVGHVEP